MSGNNMYTAAVREDLQSMQSPSWNTTQHLNSHARRAAQLVLKHNSLRLRIPSLTHTSSSGIPFLGGSLRYSSASPRTRFM